MQIDSANLPDHAHLEADVAVVGSGPAGTVMALELARAGHDVVVVESGRHRYDPDIQRLADTVPRDPYSAPMSHATRRQLGGASVLWGGRCVPFDRLDFEPRAIVPEARWPIAYDDVSGYFQRACDWLACGRADFDAGAIGCLAGSSLVSGMPNGDVRTTSLERWSLPTNFAREYGAAMKRSPLIRLVTGLTCTALAYEERASRVRHLEARALDGKRATVRARRYVLACGGLEGARLLLASNAREPGRFDDGSAHLGRWYMSHVNGRIARVRFGVPVIHGHELDEDGIYVRRRFTFAPDFLVRQRLPNGAMWFVNPEIGDPSHGSAALSLVYLLLASPLGGRFTAPSVRQLHGKAPPPGAVRAHLGNIAGNLGSAASFGARFAYGRYLKRGRKLPGFTMSSEANVYPLIYHGEHLPQRASRVVLSGEVDALGVPRLETDLRYAEAEIEDVVRAHRHLDDYLRRHGLGQLDYITDDPEASIRDQLRAGYHQAGLTRMSARPEDGVVDPNLAVHGFEDLYVASSSTFVTSGQAHSTFMIVAFALRLADHLRRGLSRRS